MRGNLFAAALCLTACAPTFDDQPYLVDEPRLIDVVVTPPEARPGESVTLTPVVASAQSSAVALSVWLCPEPTAVGDPRPVHESCLPPPSDSIALNVRGTRLQIPRDACARFGPTPVAAETRPADPDATGGYYQPIAIGGLNVVTSARIRIRCPLPNLSTDLARTFEEQYTSNSNPAIGGLTLVRAGAEQTDLSLPAQGSVELRLIWDAGSVESYVAPAPDNGSLVWRTESLRVTWFTSRGVLASSATGPDSEPGSSTNTLSADASALDLWAVLQDDRGGSAAKRWHLQR